MAYATRCLQSLRFCNSSLNIRKYFHNIKCLCLLLFVPSFSSSVIFFFSLSGSNKPHSQLISFRTLVCCVLGTYSYFPCIYLDKNRKQMCFQRKLYQPLRINSSRRQNYALICILFSWGLRDIWNYWTLRECYFRNKPPNDE